MENQRCEPLAAYHRFNFLQVCFLHFFFISNTYSVTGIGAREGSRRFPGSKIIRHQEEDWRNYFSAEQQHAKNLSGAYRSLAKNNLTSKGLSLFTMYTMNNVHTHLLFCVVLLVQYIYTASNNFISNVCWDQRIIFCLIAFKVFCAFVYINFF